MPSPRGLSGLWRAPESRKGRITRAVRQVHGRNCMILWIFAGISRAGSLQYNPAALISVAVLVWHSGLPVRKNRFQINQEKTLSHDKQFFTTFFAIMGALAVLAIILVIIAINLTSEDAEFKPDEVVLENIKPVGQVYVAGESEPEPEPAAAATADAGPKSGDEIYNSSCAACHATGAAGAPKLGDTAAWAPRIAQGMDALVSNAINGLNAMPPKGLCMTCSDADLKAAVEYMVSQSQ